MKYISTRGRTDPVSFSEAVAIGLAPDGGLYLPESLPDLREEMKGWEGLTYEETCLSFLKHFATDVDHGALADLVEKSYRRFAVEVRAPVRQLDENLWVLELFHGPTLAFKDFALQLLGNLYAHQIQRTGKPLNILVATSGDTGAAAIHGLVGKKGVKIFILYPNGRIAPLQERQMTCTGADNVFPLAIEGNFDDAQLALKETFSDQGFKREVNLSAVNSINLARLLAQCVYYIFGYWQLPREVRDIAQFVVPTGNFGNVLSGWMAQNAGLPVKSFRVATNQNDILHRLFSTGHYRVHPVIASLAPSMDIQVASNFERFLFYFLGGNGKEVRSVMSSIRESGVYSFAGFDTDTLSSSKTDDQEIRKIICAVFERYGYVIDPHTACGFTQMDGDHPQMILSTAHPAKFPDTIAACTGSEPTHPSLERLKSKPETKYEVPAQADAIKTFIREHV